jgi:hypothetical protein
LTTLIRLEELGVFLFSIYLYSLLRYPWWLFPILLFTPDLSILGYSLGPAVGAVTYNIVHHRFVALALIVVGMLAPLPVMSLVGVMLLAHASLDRALGYGLKHQDAFTHTHLGWIGRGTPAFGQRLPADESQSEPGEPAA